MVQIRSLSLSPGQNETQRMAKYPARGGGGRHPWVESSTDLAPPCSELGMTLGELNRNGSVAEVLILASTSLPCVLLIRTSPCGQANDPIHPCDAADASVPARRLVLSVCIHRTHTDSVGSKGGGNLGPTFITTAGNQKSQDMQYAPMFTVYRSNHRKR